MVLLAIVVVFALVSVACGGRAVAKQNSVLTALEAQYASWKGVRYRMGGLSKKGVDCSGFVYLTYKSRFHKTIPRSTKLLATYGSGVRKTKLRPGDLVFFRTSRKVRHVGIYFKDNKFIHASTSKGVMISSLKEKYWAKRYWQSRRVLHL